jgi:hypothetical protein
VPEAYDLPISHFSGDSIVGAFDNGPDATTQVAGHRGPYLQKIVPLSGVITAGTTVKTGPVSDGGNGNDYVWSRDGRVTGFWIGNAAADPAVQSQLLFQFWIQTQAQSTEGADVQVDVPEPVLLEMGKFWEFIPYLHEVRSVDRPWVFALTNASGDDQTVEVWVQFESNT